jgi:hypothetical protein
MAEKQIEEMESKEVLRKVRRLSGTTEVVLIEWVKDGEACRGFVPAKKFSAEGMPDSVLSKATPYGLPWAKLASFQASPEELEKALHNADIWTMDDLITKIQAAIGAIQTAYHLDYAALKTAAKNYKTEVEK